jgi:hypothetical protein
LCADYLGAQIAEEQVLKILIDNGFKVIDVDVVNIARQCIGRSIYRRSAAPSEAPATVDCSSFIKWLYGQLGIWLPRRSIQQRQLGEHIHLGEMITGDVVFVSGCIDYYFDDPSDGVGHVGLYAGGGTVIHAANKKVGVTESLLDGFLNEGHKFRGARRYIPKDKKVFTLETPPSREIEIMDDMRWVILQSLPKVDLV